MKPDPTHVRESIRTYAGAHALYTYDAQMAELAALRHRFETEAPVVSIGPVAGDRLLASLACHIDLDAPPGLAARQLASTVLDLLEGYANNQPPGALFALERSLKA
jgi:hypothetical protein